MMSRIIIEKRDGMKVIIEDKAEMEVRDQTNGFSVDIDDYWNVELVKHHGYTCAKFTRQD